MSSPADSVKALLIVLAATGCARRDAPYHFRAPMLTAVRAPELHGSRAQTPPQSETMTVRRERPRWRPDTIVMPAPGERAEPSPSPGGVTEVLRARVGDEVEGDAAAFALSLLDELGAELEPTVREVGSAAALFSLARDRDALGDGTPLTGDLAFFATGDEVDVVGVVCDVDERGAIEFVYLQRGVVRRGWVSPARAAAQRDDGGRILNTFVRPGLPADPAGADYLASELYRGFARLDRLVAL